MLQAMLHINLEISCYVDFTWTPGKPKTNIDEMVITEFQNYWDSEFPRVGECHTSDKEKKWTGGSGCGYCEWVHLGCNVDGWAAGRGLTGHASSDMVSYIEDSIGKDEVEVRALIEESRMSQEELTRDEYLSRGMKVLRYMRMCNQDYFENEHEHEGGQASSHSSHVHNGDQTYTQEYADGARVYTEMEIDTRQVVNEAIGSGNTNPIGKEHLLDDNASILLTSKSTSKGGGRTGLVGDKPLPAVHKYNYDTHDTRPQENAGKDFDMVYSRLHGYKIKITDEDTSLAYKKVLSDIKVAQHIYHFTSHFGMLPLTCLM